MSLMKPTTTTTPLRRWTVDEYHRLADLGLFNGQRVELLGGRILQMPAHRDVHAVGIGLAFAAVAPVFPGCWTRMQLPLHLSKWSEPEPDVSVVAGQARDYLGKGHPRSALLIIEVSDTSLKLDRGPRLRRYAHAGIEDYWIVNLSDRVIEVYRKPRLAGPEPGYEQKMVFTVAQSISPVHAPQATIAVADLLP